jgi:NAD-dependent SIR2 family protein deacetylase
MSEHDLDRAAQAIARADALLIGAGAGMGVDSGLPDFRSDQGFWRAYPPYEHLGLDFVSLADPRWFADDPALAWGFYGHRMQLYRQTEPHQGFAILHRWAGRMPRGGFAFTSNVDRHFQRAGFSPEQIVEIHGSFEAMQCTRECGIGLFSGESVSVTIDPTTMRAISALPCCPQCGGLARPNILMFGDWSWNSTRTDDQLSLMNTWLESLEGASVVVIECGAGQAIPTVRSTCERFARKFGGLLIRINPREPEVPDGNVSLPVSALAALQALDVRLLEPAD